MIRVVIAVMALTVVLGPVVCAESVTERKVKKKFEGKNVPTIRAVKLKPPVVSQPYKFKPTSTDYKGKSKTRKIYLRPEDHPSIPGPIGPVGPRPKIKPSGGGTSPFEHPTVPIPVGPIPVVPGVWPTGPVGPRPRIKPVHPMNKPGSRLQLPAPEIRRARSMTSMEIGK